MPQRKRQKHDSEAVRLEAARLLATGHNCREVAEKVGVGVSAVYNWRKKLEFKELVEDIQQEIHQAAIAKTISKTEEIIDKLFSKATTELSPIGLSHADQISASRLLVHLSERAIDTAMTKRVKRLEETIEQLLAKIEELTNRASEGK